MSSTVAVLLPKENARRKNRFQLCFLAVTALYGFQVQFHALPGFRIRLPSDNNGRRLRASSRNVPIKNDNQQKSARSTYNVSKYQNHYRMVDETTDPNEVTLQELDTLFHKRRRNELSRALLSVSNMMVWDVMDDSWEGYLSNFPVYRVPAVRNNSRKSQDFRLDLERLVDGSENGGNDKVNYFYFPHQDDLCRAAKIFVEYNRNATTTALLPPVKHVLFVGFSRDFGAFSVPVKGAYWNEEFNNTTRYWESCLGDDGEDLIQEYLDHGDTLAVITTQSHDLHTQKGHSIPLGLQHPDHARAILAHFQRELKEQERDVHTATAPDEEIAVPWLGSRAKRLMVNSKPWPWRHLTLKNIERAFKVHNTYDPGNRYQKYLEEMADSRFVLSPVGWGIDCYRNYEALYLGSIPVMETNNRTDKLFEVYQGLPVAWIDDLNHVTPEWLDDEYTRILHNYKSYNWSKLTKQYWVEYAKAFGSTSERGATII